VWNEGGAACVQMIADSAQDGSSGSDGRIGRNGGNCERLTKGVGVKWLQQRHDLALTAARTLTISTDSISHGSQPGRLQYAYAALLAIICAAAQHGQQCCATLPSAALPSPVRMCALAW
jgi:hypothetical protein